MEFRLLYRGELLPSGNSNRRAREKHEIRKQFHPQLRRLWSVERNLRQLAILRATHYKDDVREESQRPIPKDQNEAFDLGMQAVGLKWSRAGFQFIPLVTEDMVLRCSLDILLLRPEEKKLIFESGDIDGQIKTLFDALRLPSENSETGGALPDQDEHPFYCLLEDDRLITDFRVTADKLLLLPSEREVKANDAFVVIHVALNHRPARTFDNWFG
jgi:hypothetical protein